MDIDHIDEDLIDLTKSTTRINVKRKRLSDVCQSIPLMGFGTYGINDPNVITNALTMELGRRHTRRARRWN